ncbi:ATP-binding protein [Streptomyces sp. MMBL 11-3]|uniref:ATP-binding protein n=1 Tax=Streptomyces sp. MMBL 11-3 TaxID=3382639 RepID=UPI0039B69308
MNSAGQGEGRQPVAESGLSICAAFEGGAGIAASRATARTFLESVQTEHGLPVSSRVMGMVQLVVSELVTNAHKHAPGPCVVTLEVRDGAVETSVWDSSTVLPTIMAPDPGRIGRHGLEIVMAVCRSFEVHREPVGKRIKTAVVLADDPGGHVSGHRPM